MEREKNCIKISLPPLKTPMKNYLKKNIHNIIELHKIRRGTKPQK
jgi:hypothetical protein